MRLRITGSLVEIAGTYVAKTINNTKLQKPGEGVVRLDDERPFGYARAQARRKGVTGKLGLATVSWLRPSNAYRFR
jgi:hypothetical protein